MVTFSTVPSDSGTVTVPDRALFGSVDARPDPADHGGAVGRGCAWPVLVLVLLAYGLVKNCEAAGGSYSPVLYHVPTNPFPCIKRQAARIEGRTAYCRGPAGRLHLLEALIIHLILESERTGVRRCCSWPADCEQNKRKGQGETGSGS